MSPLVRLTGVTYVRRNRTTTQNGDQAEWARCADPAFATFVCATDEAGVQRVVTDSGSDIVRFLRRFNEKTLAVETEAGGVGQAFYEEMGSEPPSGWLTILGISDLAGPNKGHGWHQLAADHAAAVMDRLLPMLAMPGGRPAGAATVASIQPPPSTSGTTPQPIATESRCAAAACQNQPGSSEPLESAGA